MWVVREYQIETRQLDFTSAGLGRDSTRVLSSDSVSIVNALKYFEFEANPAQALVCEHCGTPGCGTSSWVALRSLGSDALFIPAFAEMRQGDWELAEYGPPPYMESRGALLFPGEIYRALRAEVPGFPSCESLPPLTLGEAIDVLQWEAPLEVLGSFPGPPTLRREDVLAVSSGEIDDAVHALLQLLDDRGAPGRPLSPAKPAEVISFFLDGPGFPEWSPIGRDESAEVVFNLAPGIGAARQGRLPGG